MIEIGLEVERLKNGHIGAEKEHQKDYTKRV